MKEKRDLKEGNARISLNNYNLYTNHVYKSKAKCGYVLFKCIQHWKTRKLPFLSKTYIGLFRCILASL